MTHPEFRKFKVDWQVFRRRTRLPLEQVAVELYSACDNAVQNAIVNTCDDFFSLDEESIISLIEQIVTKRSNPAVHRLNFSKLVQAETESISDYLVRLKSTARDCEFSCPNCKFDLMPVNVKDQMIRGIHSEILQTDILSKASTLKSLEDIVKHAESFESAVSDQSKLQDSGEAMRFRFKGKKQQKNNRIIFLNPVENCPVMDVARSTMVAWVVLLLAQHGGKIVLIVEPQTTLQVAASSYLKTNKTTLMLVLKHLLLMSRWRMMSSRVPQTVTLS